MLSKMDGGSNGGCGCAVMVAVLAAIAIGVGVFYEDRKKGDEQLVGFLADHCQVQRIEKGRFFDTTCYRCIVERKEDLYRGSANRSSSLETAEKLGGLDALARGVEVCR